MSRCGFTQLRFSRLFSSSVDNTNYNISVSIIVFLFTDKNNPRNIYILMAFLLTPQILKNYTTHLIQGLAMALFYTGVFNNKKTHYGSMIYVTPFIHASFFLVILLVKIPGIFNRLKLGVGIHITLLLIFAFVIIMSAGFLATSLEFRQVEYYNFSMTTVTGLGFIYWFLVMLLFLFQGVAFLETH